jgi:hypothetical protein
MPTACSVKNKCKKRKDREAYFIISSQGRMDY